MHLDVFQETDRLPTMQFYYESCQTSPSSIPPTIPIHARAFLYGDHAYEVLRTYQQIPFGVEKHFERWLTSLTYLNYDIYPAFETFCQDISKILTYAYQTLKLKDELYIRCHFGRSEDNHISLAPDVSLKPIWFYIGAPLTLIQPTYGMKTGLRLGIAPVRRLVPETFSPNIKTGNYGNNMVGCMDAKRRGFDDAVFLDALNNHILEGSTFNVVFLDKKGTLVVPHAHKPRDRYLKGITLSSLIDSRPPLPVRFQDIAVTDLSHYPHCLVLSTTREIQWVQCIEKHVFRPPPKKLLEPLQAHFKKGVQKDIAQFQKQIKKLTGYPLAVS